MRARLIEIGHPAARTLSSVIEVNEAIGFRAGQSCDLTHAPNRDLMDESPPLMAEDRR
jgi:hypothetical protein